ncbi:MAG: YihA family ribosome biogenesis GTP-binding protein [Clostridia bacterium]|nr:YihA family ribosome biogenesis GTP-binding protein [Oscillospiraceae bacterium]MBR3956104.1 YihA family ribosome biogenesis GTP-binding protein [Clostridia bacterium]
MNYNNVTFEAAYGTAKQLPVSDLPEIVFSGRSNVGKSSLINKLFNRKNLARVSSVPGKTTTVNFFRCEDVRFADLPGYGYAKRSGDEIRRWSNLMEGYFQSERNIKLVVQLVDMRHKPTADDRTMIDFLSAAGVPFVIALTKSDKLKKTERAKREQEIPEELPGLETIAFSSENGEGVEALKARIEAALTE